jgi:hypothetical protein
VGARGRAIVGGRVFDDDDPFGLLAELGGACALLWGRVVGEEAVAALLAVAGVRGLVAAEPGGVDLPDALLAALIDDEDADDRVLTRDGR